MKAGTIIRLPDGREGTVVYNGLDGVGIKWGRHVISIEDVGGGSWYEAPRDYEWFPDAMLREPYPSAEIPCVGEEFEIVRECLDIKE